MSIKQIPQAWIKYSFFIGFIAVLSACGGGGKKSDTTPNSFSFTPVTNAQPSTQVTSNTITIGGINAAAAISISGGQYSIGGGAPTSAAGTITNGQSLTVTVTTSASTNTPVTATVNIGGVSGAFTVTTLADTTPDAFTFTPATDVEPGSVQTSAITVAGIDIAVPISITGGEYAIGTGVFTSAVGTVSAGQAVTVRVTASAGTNATESAILTIGGVSGTYSVTTVVDTQAPTAEILFPPPVSMTEGTTLLVRGKAADDYNQIENVQIRVNEGTAQNVVLTENDDGSASWQVEVSLIAGTNTITVSTEDSEGNSELTAAQVSVRQDVTLGSFPDAAIPIPGPNAVVIDRLNGRNRLLVTADSSTRSVYSVDLTTGARSVFKNYQSLPGQFFGATYDLLLDESADRLLLRDAGSLIATLDLEDPSLFNVYTVPDIGDGFVFVFDDTSVPNTLMNANQENGNLVRVSLDLTNTEIFSDSSNVEQGPAMTRSRGMVFDKTNQRYLLTALLEHTIYAVDSNTGMRSIFAQNGLSNGPDFGTEPNVFLYELIMDSDRNRVLVAESTSGRLFAIDLTTGDRSILSSQTSPHDFNPMDRLRSLIINSPDSYIFITDAHDNSIFAVDIITGHRVYFTKN